MPVFARFHILVFPPSILAIDKNFKRGAKVLKNIEYNEKKILYYIYKIKKKFKNSFHFRYGNSTKKITNIINNKKFRKISLQKHFVKDNN